MIGMPMQMMEVSCSDSQDILSELRTFIAGASRTSEVNQLNLVRTAISLLKTLPAASEAVLEFFCTVFHNYVSRYLSLIEVNNVMIFYEFDMGKNQLFNSANCELGWND